MRLPGWISQHLAAARALLVFTVLLGIAYPLVVAGVGQAAFYTQANGSIIERDGQKVGSSLLGQSFEDRPEYFQSRPSAAGVGYDPTSTSASNLGPESVVDTLGDPAIDPESGEGNGSKQSLLTQVCARSKAVGEREGVDGSRPFCTPGGVGAVLGLFREGGLTGRITKVVSLNEPASSYDRATKAAKKNDSAFVASYEGVPVELAVFGEDYSKAIVTPIRGNAPAKPAVPGDAVTSSGSGLDPHISPAYAQLQLARVARARGVEGARLRKLVDEHTTGRALGFMGEPAVNVLELNLVLDQRYPKKG
ncbi:potassium-transporting ATPase subunit C [Longispora albida]|uniref:potassium-transporting ATPase subunit C n=1 Tax=Longispora albida TaxID=203523 RepID=UPI000369FA04|nr:potassium-transporting ATPase subunit C [Longispora albida]